MSEVRIVVTGMLFPLPEDPETFALVARGKCVEAAWNDLRRRLLGHLRNRVPFVVQDQERVASFDCEVIICD